MDDVLANMQSLIHDALDGVVSARSSTSKRSQSLDELEQVLARTLAPDAGPEYLETFAFLQDTFECNVPSRLIDWVSTASLRLDHLLSRGASDSDKGTEAAILSGQITQALSLIQGVALVHHRSKMLLGGKHAQEVLVDLLWASRHSGSPDADAASSSTQATPTPKSKGTTATSLSSAVLDTLLCILVDSSPALRVFEKAGGVKTVVNLVKRPKALRDVKMKCLEFLYFYLLDESTADTDTPLNSVLPPMPLSPSPFIESRTRRVARDASWGSDDSYSSASSHSSSLSGSSSTSATSFSSADRSPKTPPRSPTNNVSGPGAATPRRPFAKPRALLLLQKDVDYTPLSPKKSHGARAASARYGTPLKAPALGVGMPSSPSTPTQSSSSRRASEDTVAATPVEAGSCNADGTRSTEQKKEYLGTMLGNVDALVAGVRSAFATQ